MVSAFHYAEEWTSSGDTWEGRQSGPAESECSELGKEMACRKGTVTSYFKMSTFNTNV